MSRGVRFSSWSESVQNATTTMHQCVFQNDLIFCIFFFSPAGHGRKTGTNLHAALYRVSEVINFFRQNSARNHFNETQNIIVIETDGKDTGNVAQSMKKSLIFRVIIFMSFCPQVTPTQGSSLRLPWPRSGICWATTTHPTITQMRQCWVS